MIATEEQTRALVDMLSDALDDISDLREDIENKQRADRENDAWRKWASLLCGGARNKGIAHESNPENVRSMSLVGMGLFGAVDELKALAGAVSDLFEVGYLLGWQAHSVMPTPETVRSLREFLVPRVEALAQTETKHSLLRKHTEAASQILRDAKADPAGLTLGEMIEEMGRLLRFTRAMLSLCGTLDPEHEDTYPPPAISITCTATLDEVTP